jgi:hypothetical protein
MNQCGYVPVNITLDSSLQGQTDVTRICNEEISFLREVLVQKCRLGW